MKSFCVRISCVSHIVSDYREISMELGTFEGQGSIRIVRINCEYPSGHLEGVDTAYQRLFNARSSHSNDRVICKLSARSGAKC